MRHCSKLNVYNNNLLCLLFFFTLSCVNTNNCSLDLYNGDLQTTIVLFTRNATSHKTLLICYLFCLAYYIAGKTLWRTNLEENDSSWNLCKYKHHYCWCFLFTFILVILVVASCSSLFLYIFLIYFCLFVDHVNKSIVFNAFVYHFNVAYMI